MNPAPPLPDYSQWLVTLFSAIAAGLLGLMPVYQRFMEVRREQQRKDLEAGISQEIPRGETIRETFRSREVLIAVFLVVVVLLGLIMSDLRIRAFRSEWRAVVEPAQEHQREMLDALRRIEARLRP